MILDSLLWVRMQNTKFEYINIYENNADNFSIGHCQVKVKVTVGLQKFPHLPIYRDVNCQGQ